jgi:hypothetical protein
MAVLNLDIAQRLDIVCRKGDTFEFSFDVGDSLSSLTGTWTMEVRPTEDADQAGDIILSLSASNLPSGVITLTGTNAQMGALVAGLYVYDIQLKTATTTKTYLYGTFKINDDITTV